MRLMVYPKSNQKAFPPSVPKDVLFPSMLAFRCEQQKPKTYNVKRSLCTGAASAKGQTPGQVM
ncbi:hypothetical protein M419DRAFT_119174 [Trichoderma reesei RUT C-30]|uniref:Uncharacterized protein n=1 Tax=Hypocrea jecorina (strain ATCC 56765 / BCRC 32924 / NRRL 11460 / Rut C-30) TaxID=1344414 RepID=A0A024S7Z6_HYPJR|nr:hypothetical protein M419DRAFT_119174 [Trichoderma reesei RUT C-30]